MLSSSISQIITCKYPSILYTVADNSLYLGLLFGACGVLGELENNDNLHKCLRTNLKIASNFVLLGSLLNLYRINRIQ